MLTAYYSKGADSEKMFSGLEISKAADFRKHLNKYDLIHIDVQWFLTNCAKADDVVAFITESILDELRTIYPCVLPSEEISLPDALSRIREKTGQKFVVIIDEWDVLIRDAAANSKVQKEYINFLRAMFKGTEPTKYIQLAYLTGILPIKKYGSHSALNMFTEYSMTDPGDFAEYFGFTEQEVLELCEKYEMSFEEAKIWYDGYQLVVHRKEKDECYSMYSPKSVVEAMLRHKFGTYWNQTETYEALKIYIQMDMDGLKDSVVRMLASESVSINIGTFSNDMTTFATKDDVLTLLVHLGYLTYSVIDRTVRIPNKEVAQEYVNAISTMNWYGVMESLEASRKLLEELWAMDEDAVAAGIEKAHEEISILQYNDENSLSCTINLAFYFAREYYTIVREMPAGKGYADICMIPRKEHLDKPAVVIELKWDKSTVGALEQIKEKNYGSDLKEYQGKLLLVGINYNRKTKKHECAIEVMEK